MEYNIGGNRSDRNWFGWEMTRSELIAYHHSTLFKKYFYRRITTKIFRGNLAYEFTCLGDIYTQHTEKTEGQLIVKIKNNITPTNSNVFK